MAGAPPRTRPPDDTTQAPPELQLLAWEADGPIWPNVLNSRFDASTEEHKTLMEKKAELEASFPPQTRRTSLGSGSRGRAGGVCDFAIDGGTQPLDISREVSLPVVAEGDAQGELDGRPF